MMSTGSPARLLFSSSSPLCLKMQTSEISPYSHFPASAAAHAEASLPPSPLAANMATQPCYPGHQSASKNLVLLPLRVAGMPRQGRGPEILQAVTAGS